MTYFVTCCETIEASSAETAALKFTEHNRKRVHRLRVVVCDANEQIIVDVDTQQQKVLRVLR
jgi:hypothetical protein